MKKTVKTQTKDMDIILKSSMDRSTLNKVRAQVLESIFHKFREMGVAEE